MPKLKLTLERYPDQSDTVEKLDAVLRPHGILAEIDYDSHNQYLVVLYSDEDQRSARTRGAGRKTALSEHTIAEVHAYAQGHTVAEAAAYAGLSVRTYQRRVAEYKATGWWEDGCAPDLLYFGQPVFDAAQVPASLRVPALQAWTAHCKAFSVWRYGAPRRVWRDEEGRLCIEYDNQEWYHYRQEGYNHWIWW